MRLSVRRFARSWNRTAHISARLHPGLSLLSLEGQGIDEALRGVLGFDNRLFSEEEETAARGALLLDGRGRVLCPATVVKPVRYSSGQVELDGVKRLVQLPGGCAEALRSQLVGLVGEERLEVADLSGEFEHFSIFSDSASEVSRQPRKEGALFREIYGQLRLDRATEEGDFIGAFFVDPRERSLGVQAISLRENGLFRQVAGRSFEAEIQGQEKAYTFSRLLRHLFEAEEIAGFFPQSINADFMRLNFQSERDQRIKKRATMFLVGDEAPTRRASSKDDRALLRELFDPSYPADFAGQILVDRNGRKAALLVKNHGNLAIGFYDFGSCQQDDFAHDGKVFTRIRYEPFEHYINAEKKKWASS